MLVLSRQTNESIVLMDGQIRIRILAVQGDQVKIGIEAPRDITVLREEIYLSQRQNQQAVASLSPDALTEWPSAPGSPPPQRPKSP